MLNENWRKNWGGLSVPIDEVMRISAQPHTLWEHVRVYKCVTDNQIEINDLEISEGRYWTLPELTQSIESNPKIFTSTFHLIFNAYIIKSIENYYQDDI